MPRDEVDDLFDELTDHFKEKDTQEELRLLVTQTPPNVRQQIEKQELAIEGIEYSEDGNHTSKGRPAEESLLKAALDRVDKRMLRESPALQEHRLLFSGGYLIPDRAAYRREL